MSDVNESYFIIDIESIITSEHPTWWFGQLTKIIYRSLVLLFYRLEVLLKSYPLHIMHVFECCFIYYEYVYFILNVSIDCIL